MTLVRASASCSSSRPYIAFLRQLQRAIDVARTESRKVGAAKDLAGFAGLELLPPAAV